MRIVITGNMGYVGPVLTRYLKANFPSYQLIGIDSAYFAHNLTNARILPEAQIDQQHFTDVRDLPAETFLGVDAVVHLAAISNDPMGSKFELATEDINKSASLRVIDAAKTAGVKNFVFASSCSMYGFAEGGARKESDPTYPLTAYAKSKVQTEEAARTMEIGKMNLSFLRFATACGMSDRLRLDLVLNDFVACAVTSGQISVLSNGEPWRPLIDVEDMARAIAWAIHRESSCGGQILSVNVGRDEWNYQVKDLAAAVASVVNGTSVNINLDAPPDKRSYRVDFSLFKRLAPQHIPQMTLNESIIRLRDGLRDMSFADPAFRQSSYMRLKTLEQHIEARRLNNDLRWTSRKI